MFCCAKRKLIGELGELSRVQVIKLLENEKSSFLRGKMFKSFKV